MSNRQFVFVIVMVFFTVFIANFASDTLKMFIDKEETYVVDGIVTCVDDGTASIVDMNGEAWLYADDNLERCDSVRLTISDNGTRNIDDDVIISVNQKGEPAKAGFLLLKMNNLFWKMHKKIEVYKTDIL